MTVKSAGMPVDGAGMPVESAEMPVKSAEMTGDGAGMTVDGALRIIPVVQAGDGEAAAQVPHFVGDGGQGGVIINGGQGADD